MTILQNLEYIINKHTHIRIGQISGTKTKRHFLIIQFYQPVFKKSRNDLIKFGDMELTPPLYSPDYKSFATSGLLIFPPS